MFVSAIEVIVSLVPDSDATTVRESVGVKAPLDIVTVAFVGENHKIPA